MSKILVCIIGNLRGGELPVKMMKKHLLDPFNADLALCIGDRFNDDNSGYMSLAKYTWIHTEPVEKDGWGKIFDEVGSEWRNIRPKSKRMIGLLGGLNKNASGSGGIIFSFRHWLKKKLLENDLLSKYDYFIVTRSDHVFINSHFKFDPVSICIPEGEGYSENGITDRFCIVHRDNIIKSLEILEYINIKNSIIGMGCEDTLYHFYRSIKLPIELFKRNMFSVMQIGEHSTIVPSNERKIGKYTRKLKDNLYAKYPDEYNDCEKNYKTDLKNVSNLFN